MSTPTLPHRFIFDVESIGLHGEGFAVAGGLYVGEEPIDEFAFHCDPDTAVGKPEDREWVKANVTTHERSIKQNSPRDVRQRFWELWRHAANNYQAQMFVECGWPVEAKFLEACIADDSVTRNWLGPYPMHEIASVMLAAGMDPMATYERSVYELPAHEPLADSRQSARLLFSALRNLKSK